MGQGQSTNQQQQIGNYKIKKSLTNGQYLVKKKFSSDELQLRVMTFFIEQQMKEYISLLQRRKKIKNPHLLQLVQYSKVTNNDICSTTFKLKTIFQYPFKTLQQQIQQRKIKKRYMSEDQIWVILYSTCHALFGLYLNQFYHQSINNNQIFIDTNGYIKISDGILDSCVKNYLYLMHEDMDKQHIRYISPQLANMVQDNNFSYFYNKQKSDVYILATCILQIGTLSNINYYNFQRKSFNFDAYQSNFTRFTQIYSQRLSKIIELMMSTQPKKRPTFQQILNLIDLQTIHTDSSRYSKLQTNSLKSSRSNKNKNISDQYFNKKQPNNKQLNSDKLKKQSFQNKFNNYSQNQMKIISFDQFLHQSKKSQLIKQDQLFSSNFSNKLKFSKKNKESTNKNRSNTSNYKLPQWQLSSIQLKKQKQLIRNYTPYEKLQQLKTYQRQQYNTPNKDQSFVNLLKNQASNQIQRFSLNRQKQQNYKNQFKFQQKFNKLSINAPQKDNIATLQLNNNNKNKDQEIFQIIDNQIQHYEGFLKNKQKHGMGKIYYKNGGHYQGQWENNSINGFGKLYNNNNQLVYQGYWLNGSIQGYGKFYNDSPQYGVETIDFQNMTNAQNKWIYYEGQFKNDSRYGKGTMLFVTGQRFSGCFVNNLAEGEGIFYSKIGQIIKGIWSKNKLIIKN